MTDHTMTDHTTAEHTTTDPSAPTPSGSAVLLDTREMLVIHSVFRREIALAGDLVRRVEPGDVRRAAVVGGHLDLVDRSLHHHHVTEDELLWPLLLDRAADSLAAVVHLMEAQHDELATLLREIAPLLTSWVAGADATERDDLAGRYDQLSRILSEHLEAEETCLLPLAAECLTQAEWDAMGEAGRRGAAGSERSLVFGMMMYDGDPEVVGTMLETAPPPVRLLVPWLARRAFRRHALAVYGTATPPHAGRDATV